MAKQKREKQPAQIYQLKITLEHSHPPIWRRVQVPADIRLSRLHRVIQVVMDGWEDYHLHQFIVGQRPDLEFYGMPFPDDWRPAKNETLFTLKQILKNEGDKIVYEYDFGDGWKHIILLEKVLPPEEGVFYPRCIAGKRACPPEDCGGIGGYMYLLEALADPENPEYRERLEWLGGEFDPEYFDLNGINERLRTI